MKIFFVLRVMFLPFNKLINIKVTFKNFIYNYYYFKSFYIFWVINKISFSMKKQMKFFKGIKNNT